MSKASKRETDRKIERESAYTFEIHLFDRYVHPVLLAVVNCESISKAVVDCEFLIKSVRFLRCTFLRRSLLYLRDIVLRHIAQRHLVQYINQLTNQSVAIFFRIRKFILYKRETCSLLIKINAIFEKKFSNKFILIFEKIKRQKGIRY